MNPNDPTGLNKVLMQMQPLMLSRTPDFQKFSSPSELGVPVAVGDASRLPSQCLPESSNTKLSKSQQHPKALSFSFTRFPHPEASKNVVQYLFNLFTLREHVPALYWWKRKRLSCEERCLYWIPLSHLSLLSTRRHPNEFQTVINTSLRTIDSHCYVGVLLPWASSAVLLSPPRRTLGCAKLVRKHCSVWGSSGTSLKIREHPRLPITFQLRDLVFTLSVVSHDVYASESVSNTETWMLDIENQLRDQVFVSDFVYTPGWRQRDRSNSQTWPKRSPRSTARHSKFWVSSRNTDINGLHWRV